MDIKTLERLQKLNQLKLTEEETARLMDFFAQVEKDAEILSTVNTENVERMVYVMPMTNIIREDIAKKLLSDTITATTEIEKIYVQEVHLGSVEEYPLCQK